MGSGCFLSLLCPAPLLAGASPAPAVCFPHGGLLTELHELPGVLLSSAVWPEPPSSAQGWCVLCALTLRVPCCSPGLALPLGCYCPFRWVSRWNAGARSSSSCSAEVLNTASRCVCETQKKPRAPG